MNIPAELPTDLAEAGWRVLPDPEILGSHLWVCDIPRTTNILVVAIAEEGAPNYSVIQLPRELEFTLRTEVDGVCLYPENTQGMVSLGEAVEYAGSFL